MMEKPPSQEAAPVYEPEVVAKLHINHDKVLNGELSLSEKLLSEIQSDLSRLECYPMYKEYVEGRVPTLSGLQESARRATSAIDELLAQDRATGSTDEDLAEESKIKNLIAGRANSIKRNVGAYIQTVITFHRLQKNYRNNPEDFEKADHNRRRAHDALLQSLKIMTDTVQKAGEEGLLPDKKIIQWMHGLSAAELMNDPEVILVFSDKSLKDRDQIRDWAIAADFDTQLKEMLAAQKQDAAE